MSSIFPNGFTSALNNVPASVIEGLWAETQGIIDEAALRICPPQTVNNQTGNISIWNENGMVVTGGVDGADVKKDFGSLPSAGQFTTTTVSYQLELNRFGSMSFEPHQVAIFEGALATDPVSAYIKKLVHQASQLYAFKVGGVLGTSGNYGSNTTSGAGLTAVGGDIIGKINDALDTLEAAGVDTSSGMKVVMNVKAARLLMKNNQISSFGGAIAYDSATPTTVKLGFADSVDFSALRQFFARAFIVPIDLEVMKSRYLAQSGSTQTPSYAIGNVISLLKSEGGYNSFVRGFTMGQTPDGAASGNIGVVQTAAIPVPVGSVQVYCDMYTQVRTISSKYGFLYTSVY
jgi:hypothetical protein